MARTKQTTQTTVAIPTTIESIEDLAKVLVAKNPVLKDTVQASPKANYHPVKDIIAPNMKAISQSLYHGKFVAVRDLTYAIINEVEGTVRTKQTLVF